MILKDYPNLEQIITKRLDNSLLEKKALELLTKNSGGLPRELIYLTRLAWIQAILTKQSIITKDAVEKAILNRRRDFQLQLTTEWIELLRGVQKAQWLEPKEENQPLLENLSVLEYRNNDPWYDVHPLVEPLLKEKARK
jgi:hypothetical protein